MTLSLQEISDRFEIQDLMVGYCYAVDDRDFDALDNIFTPDAMIDYSEMVAGMKGSLPEIKTFLSSSLSRIPHYQHAVSTTQYRIEGDRAETRTICSNPMVVPGDDGGEQTLFFGLWYINEYIRTPQGWRISALREKKCYTHNVPAWIKAETQGT